MTTKKNLIKLALISVCFLGLTLSVPAQRKRSRTASPKPTPTPTVVKTDLKSGAEKVSIQIKNVTKFLYILGGVAKGIENIDKEIKAGKASRQIADQNANFKKDVLQSIRNLRAGLVALEIEFRTKPQLRPFLFQIQGISDISATAEDQAISGQFNESGKTLLFVVEKLADTLAAMP
ncbi:MAG: hypothetical protein R2747_16325 [Pyrinomonadaceae bacterium]